jgi:hypothetical protein
LATKPSSPAPLDRLPGARTVGFRPAHRQDHPAAVDGVFEDRAATMQRQAANVVRPDLEMSKAMNVGGV